MVIEEYKFGKIKISGKEYLHDVEVRWSPKDSDVTSEPTGQAGEVLAWQRTESHVIDTEDIKRALEQGPEIIIIGKGESGVARVTENAKKEIKSKGIKLIIDTTEEAIKTFNVLLSQAEEDEEELKIIGLFHLTC